MSDIEQHEFSDEDISFLDDGEGFLCFKVDIEKLEVTDQTFIYFKERDVKEMAIHFGLIEGEG